MFRNKRGDRFAKSKGAQLYSDSSLIEQLETGFAQQYPYDYAKELARKQANDPKVKAMFYDKLKKELNAPFEKQLETQLKEIDWHMRFNADRLWIETSKSYRHVRPDDIIYSIPRQTTKTEDSLDLKYVEVKNFAEYQYVRAIDIILEKCGINDKQLTAVLDTAVKSSFKPERYDNGFPGAKWDALQTVWRGNSDIESDIEKDLVELVHYCANNQEPNIKESWLFQYANLLPLNLTDEENEAEELLVLTAKNCSSVYFKTIVALVKCVQVNMIEGIQNSLEKMAGESLSDNKEVSPTMAERMQKLGLYSSSINANDEQEFLLDVIKIMQSDGIKVTLLGMNAFFIKKVKEFETKEETLVRETEEKQQQVEKKKTGFFWAVVAFLTLVNCLLEKNVLDVCVQNELNDIDLFSNLWPMTLGSAWIAIFASLFGTAILGRVLLKGKKTTWVLLSEVGALLVWAILLAFVLPPCDTILENIGGFLGVIVGLYAIPIGICLWILKRIDNKAKRNV